MSPLGSSSRRPPVPGVRTLVPAFLAVLLAPAPLLAQRRNFVEVGVAGAFLSFDQATDLGTGPGGLARLGLWLPLRFEIEGEGSFLRPKTKSAAVGVSVTTIGASVLYNLPLGVRNSAYAKLGIGSTSYGSCPQVAPSPPVICGTATSVLGGIGFRVGVTPTVMVRGEGMINRNSSNTLRFSNFGASLGLSFMLGSRSIGDSDGDGVPDNVDRCPNTPPGVVVDKRGCPVDSDGDGVPDGIDRCPATPKGVKVDAVGCPIDSDGDGVPDGIDKCPNTPKGAVVDAAGCPIDSDGDGVPDGLDRCPDTPKGATVDALGCPSDSDGDGVLDGLDKCPNTPPGTPVDASGCPVGQGPRPQGQRQPPPPAGPAPAVRGPSPRAAVLRDAAFTVGSARLRPEAYPMLDSIATVLRADTTLRVEIGGHTASSRSESDSRQLAGLRVEAVRSYLIGKGVSPQRLVPRVYGASQPVTGDTTAAGRAINRRIEITPLLPGP
jgi:OOP family OmpA-OmpF porin